MQLSLSAVLPRTGAGAILKAVEYFWILSPQLGYFAWPPGERIHLALQDLYVWVEDKQGKVASPVLRGEGEGTM